MGTLGRFVLILGILNLLAGVTLFIGGGYALGIAWLGAFDLYVALDKGAVIDHVKLAAYDPALAQGYVLGHCLVDAPAALGHQIITAGAAVLALDGVALCITAALAPRRRYTATKAGAPSN